MARKKANAEEVKQDIPAVENMENEEVEDTRDIKTVKDEETTVVPDITELDKPKEVEEVPAEEVVEDVVEEVKEVHYKLEDLNQRLIDMACTLADRVTANEFNSVGLNEDQMKSLQLVLDTYNSLKEEVK